MLMEIKQRIIYGDHSIRPGRQPESHALEHNASPPELAVIIIKHGNKSPSVRFCCHFQNITARYQRPLLRVGALGGRSRPALPLAAYLFWSNGSEELTEIKYGLPRDSYNVI